MLLPSDQWFFITGCQRSGTTLLRLVLECHPHIFCFDEFASYQVLSAASYDGEISKRLVGFKVPRWAEQLDAPVLHDFGLEFEARHIYKGQRILFLVRDYRDAIASMLKLRGERSWLEDWAQPILEAHIRHTAGFAEKWSRELALVESAPNRVVASGALYWKYKNDALLRYIERRYPVLVISYEQLVGSPKQELGRVCDFLGVPFTTTLLEHPKHPHRELFENGLTVGNTDPSRVIDSTSVGQWTVFLEPHDVAAAEKIVGDLPEMIARHLYTRPAFVPGSGTAYTLRQPDQRS